MSKPDVSESSVPPLLVLDYPATFEQVAVGLAKLNQHYKQMEAALRVQEQRIHAILEACTDGFWVVNAETGDLLEVNDIYCQLSGYSHPELLNMRIFDLDCQESVTDTISHLERLIKNQYDIFNTKHRRKNGEIWPVEITVTYSNINGGQCFVFLRDIRERYINRSLLELRVNLSDLVHSGSINSLSQFAIDRAEELTNSQIGFFHFVEADQENILLQIWSTNTLRNFCSIQEPGRHYPVATAGVWVDCIHQRCAVIHNDYASLSHKKGLPEGHPQVVRELVVPIFRNDKIVAVLGVGNKLVDYTEADTHIVKEIGDLAYDYLERKRSDERIEFMAYYDALTNLPNRTLLLNRIHQGISQIERTHKLLALAYLDLDGFKPVNDRYGHAAGDLFLKAFAQRITKILRAGDTLARLGGDEFALVIPGLSNVYDGEAMLWRLLETLAEPFCINSHEIRVGASIGFTVYPTDRADPEELLRHADQAMYQAKWHGKNTVRLYDTAHNERLRLQQETIEELRQSLQSNELNLHYQPQVNLISGEILNFEASIFWHHPKRGLLQAEEFVSILEGTHKIMLLDKWAIQQALNQIAIWDLKDKKLTISLNINYRNLCDKNFLTFIQDQANHWPNNVIERLELELNRLTIELDVNTLTSAMIDCTELGIKFSLGGYYLNHLPVEQMKSLPLHSVKLSSPMVHDAVKNIESFKRLAAAITQIKDLNLQAVAQGIDGLELAAMLVDLGCQHGQGASIAQPMAAEMVLEWNKIWHLDSRYNNLRQLDPYNLHTAVLQLAVRNVQRWTENVTRFIETKGQSECPMLCTDQCPMHDWYQGIGLFRYGDRPGFAFQSARHRSLHQLAAKLLELLENGFHERAKAKLPILHIKSSELIEMLLRLDNSSQFNLHNLKT